ncbi:anti-sigma factor antagonist, partial [Mycobacterium tuberculosis]
MSAPDSITVTVADHNGVAVLSIGGEIDLITAAALEEAIGEVVADNPTALVIDLSAVEFLGSVGLKILAATSEKIGQSVKFGVVARGSV